MKGLVKIYIDSYRGLNQPVWMLALIMLINRSGAMVIPFLGVYITQALHLGLKEAGTVLTCFGAGAVCGSWLGGWLSDRIGNFKIQLSCLILCVPVFCILPELTTALSLALGVFILGLITETFRPANSVAIASYTTTANVTKAFSLNRMAINLGFSIGPALGGFLAAYSYNLLFYGNAISAGIAGLVFFFYFNSKKGNDSKKTDAGNLTSASTSASPLKDKYFLIFCFLCCLYSICFFQLLSTLPLFYQKEHHLSEWSIGLILAFSGLVVFSLEMLLVHLAEKRFSASSVIIAGTLLCGASYVMLLLPGKYLVLYSSMFIICISEILAMPFMGTVTMMRAPKEKQGAYMGLNALSFSLAHVLSPLVGTQIAESYGFDTLWIITGLICLAASAGFWLVMKRM